ncbi:hypothetical protein F4810DRAFT_713615 [Camillea tinctor]|nr:hypothetical protein F4810DRAFT_713615 [Camillea tinctor]
MCGAQLCQFQCGHYEVQAFEVCSSAPGCSIQLSQGYIRGKNFYNSLESSTDASLMGKLKQRAREFLHPSSERSGDIIYVERKGPKCNRCLEQSPQKNSLAMATGPCLAVKHYYQCGCQPRANPTLPFRFLCSCEGDFHGFAQGLLLPISGKCDRLLCPDCGDGSYCGEEIVLPQAEIAPLLFYKDDKGTSYAPYGQFERINKDGRMKFDRSIHVV